MGNSKPATAINLLAAALRVLLYFNPSFLCAKCNSRGWNEGLSFMSEDSEAEFKVSPVGDNPVQI